MNSLVIDVEILVKPVRNIARKTKKVSSAVIVLRYFMTNVRTEHLGFFQMTIFIVGHALPFFILGYKFC